MAAAGQAFAEVGFERTTLGDVVARAGTSIGNLYKYFASKDELFEAFLPRSFAHELTHKIRARVEALRAETDALTLEASHPYRSASRELLAFTLEHRERVVFLLRRAEGTAYAKFEGDVVKQLVELAVTYADEAYPTFVATSATKRSLTRIYRAFVATLAAVLDEERTERGFLEAVALQTTYHLSGLKAFFLHHGPTATDERTTR